MKKKTVALLLSGVLILGCTVGGTLAWLTAESETVNNTFTVGNIEIELNETTGAEYLMTPGVTLAKDPTVTVKAGSEDCYVFVKVEENVENFDNFIEYDIDPNNWKPLIDCPNVYWCEVTDLTADRNIKVLGYTKYNGAFVPNEILVNDTIPKTMMQSITEDNEPTLTFTAYAVQMYPTNDTTWSAIEAWAQVENQN